MTGFGRKKYTLTPHEKRRSPRSKACAPAVVETPASRDTVTIVDFSATGARLVGSSPPPSRRDVWLSVNGLALFGTIAWRKDNYFGFKFDDSVNELDPAKIQQAFREAEIHGGQFDRDAVLRQLANKPSSSSDAKDDLKLEPEG